MVEGLLTPSFIFNWGVADRWELVLEGHHFIQLGSAVDQPRFRLEETSLTAKAVLRRGCLQGASGPSVATEFGLLLPTVQGEPGVGAQDWLIVSQRWST